MRGGKRDNAGRTKGARNKRTLEVIDKLAKLGCDPIAGMAKIAEETDDNSLKGQMYKELAQYVAPKLKAIEKQTEGEITVNVNYIDG